MKMLKILSLLAIVSIFAACGNSNVPDETETAATTVESRKSEHVVSGNFGISLKGVYKDYLKLKDAFVETDAEKAGSLAEILLVNINTTDSNPLTEEQLKQWLRGKEMIVKGLNIIKGEKDINKQREGFSIVSEGMYNNLKTFGLKDLTIYQQHCPMAFEKQGANWLSDKETVANPYFGNQMKECGEVTHVLKN